MNMMKKHGVCAVLVTALLAVALVVGCVGPVDSNGTEEYTPSAGMGGIKLNLNLDNQSRTVLPPNANIGTFAQFKLQFSPTAIVGDGLYTDAQLTAGIDITPATYTSVKVFGYLDSGASPTQLAASGEWTGSLAVLAGTSSGTFSVTLKPIADGTGTGTFEWDIDASAILSDLSTTVAPTMILTAIGTSATEPTINLLDGGDNWHNSEVLDTGFYYVDFALTLKNSTVKRFRHVLQVYENMTSTFEYTFTTAHLGIVTTSVKLTLDYARPDDFPPLFALSGGTYTGTGVINDTTNSPIVLAAGGAVTITVSNAGDVNGAATGTTPYASLTWYCNGAAIVGGTGLAYTTNDVTNDALTITRNTAGAPFNAAGTYQINVTGLIGSVPHSAEIYVKIE